MGSSPAVGSSRKRSSGSSARARAQNADELDALVKAWILEHDLDAVLARFRELEAPIAPIYDIEQIVNDPHYRARESIVDVPDDDLGTAIMPNIVPRLARTPGKIRYPGKTAIGADTDEVLERILGRKPISSQGEP